MIPERPPRRGVHTSAMSPDGKYAYMVGPREPTRRRHAGPGRRAWTMLKLDAITLQPGGAGSPSAQGSTTARSSGDKVLFGRLSVRDPDGLGLFLYDPETDEILGGVRDADMGGFIYTV